MHGQIRCIPISEDGGLHILEKRFLVYCWRVRKQRLFELFNQFQNKLPFSQWKKHSKNHIFFFLISWSNLISDEHLCWRPVNQASPVSSLNAMFTGLVTSCKELMITLHEPSTSLACYLQTGDNLAATDLQQINLELEDNFDAIVRAGGTRSLSWDQHLHGMRFSSSNNNQLALSVQWRV